MDIMVGAMIWTIINLIILLGLGVLGIYVIKLLIKALKIYINKNS